jgi:hypothetical protein
MSLTLSKSQIFVLMLLALVTVVILGLITFAAVAHINVWHSISSFVPHIMYPG